MPRRKPPTFFDGRPPRKRAPPEELEAVLCAASSAPSSAAPSATALAHGAENAEGVRTSLAHGAEDAEGVRTSLALRRGSGRGARPLQGTEQLEHGGFGARVVFVTQVIEYDANGVDYAARLSKAAYHFGLTAIPDDDDINKQHSDLAF